MSAWKQFIRGTLGKGTVASIATTMATAACGALENGNALAPINAISHILWGDGAAVRDEISVKYTLTGIAVNSAAVFSWAAVHEMLFGRKFRPRNVAASLLSGAAVAVLAYGTDYHLVPERLTPGFEKRLSNFSLFAIYSVLALSLGLGNLSQKAGTRG